MEHFLEGIAPLGLVKTLLQKKNSSLPTKFLGLMKHFLQGNVRLRYLLSEKTKPKYMSKSLEFAFNEVNNWGQNIHIRSSRLKRKKTQRIVFKNMRP